MDKTEGIRRVMVKDLNDNPGDREELENVYGRIWNTQEVRADFEVVGFMAPFVVVKRKSDRVKGTLMFQHSPRYYFNFQQA